MVDAKEVKIANWDPNKYKEEGKILFNLKIEKKPVAVFFSGAGTEYVKQAPSADATEEEKNEITALNTQNEALIAKYPDVIKSKLKNACEVLNDGVQESLDAKLRDANIAVFDEKNKRADAEESARMRGYGIVAAGVGFALLGLAAGAGIMSGPAHDAGVKEGKDAITKTLPGIKDDAYGKGFDAGTKYINDTLAKDGAYGVGFAAGSNYINGTLPGIRNDSYSKGFAAGAKYINDSLAKNDAWSLGFSAGADFINSTINATLAHKLEDKIMAGGDGNWTSQKINDTALKMFNSTDLHNMTFDNLARLYASLSFDAGKYSTPDAKNFTATLKNMLNGTFGVPNEQLQGITDPLVALTAFYDLAQFDAYTKAAGWNETNRQIGRNEILANVTAWNLTNYLNGFTGGQQDILSQTDAWNATHYNEGVAAIERLAAGWNATNYGSGWNDSFNKTLAQIVGIVDDVLNQTQINDSGSNITKLLELYKQKIEADAYDAGYQNLKMVQWMDEKTAKYLADQNYTARNDTLNVFMQNVNTYPTTCGQHGWDYVKLDENMNSSILSSIYNDKNITNATKNYIRNAINAGDKVVLLNTTNIANDSVNQSFLQRLNGKYGNVADDGKKIADADFSAIIKYVREAK